MKRCTRDAETRPRAQSSSVEASSSTCSSASSSFFLFDARTGSGSTSLLPSTSSRFLPLPLAAAPAPALDSLTRGLRALKASGLSSSDESSSRTSSLPSPFGLGSTPLTLAVEAPPVDALATGQPRRAQVPFFPVAGGFDFGLLATMSVETSIPSLSLGLGVGLSLVAEEDVVGFSAVESAKNGPSVHSAHSSQSRRVKRSTCGKEGALRPPGFSSRRCGAPAAATLFESADPDDDERDPGRGSSASSDRFSGHRRARRRATMAT